MSNMIPRTLEKLVKSSLGKGKVIIVYGPRRVGKTTLVRKIMADAPKVNQLYLNCDELRTKRALTPTSLASLEQVIGKAKMIVIDEAQRVENIGLTLKILIDAHPELNIIATGSSSFDLANKVKEPLTGRSIELLLNPLSIYEIKEHYGYQPYQLEEIYEKMMRFGAYPHIFEMDGRQAERELLTIASQYVFKDTLELVELRQQHTGILFCLEPGAGLVACRDVHRCHRIFVRHPTVDHGHGETQRNLGCLGSVGAWHQYDAHRLCLCEALEAGERDDRGRAGGIALQRPCSRLPARIQSALLGTLLQLLYHGGVADHRDDEGLTRNHRFQSGRRDYWLGRLGGVLHLGLRSVGGCAD